MTYKQALALKKAGFPSLQKINDLFLKENLGNVSPTLEEIIEELGDRFGKLSVAHTTPKMWFAFEDEGEFKKCKECRTLLREGKKCGTGKTPLEAAINLYIKINSK